MVLAHGVAPSDTVAAIKALFEIALTEITAVTHAEPTDVASALFEHIMLDTANAFSMTTTGPVPGPQVSEYVDIAALRTRVSPRQADVFQRLVDNTPTAQIATELGITRKTLKNHITDIGNRFDAHGRDEIMQKARELSILVVVPTVLLASTLVDAVNTNLF